MKISTEHHQPMDTLKLVIFDAVEHFVALREAHGLLGARDDVKSQLINYLIAKIEDPSDLLVDTILNTTSAE